MQFKVKVYQAAEGVSLLNLVAANATEAASQAQQQGYQVLSTRRKLSFAKFSRSRSMSIALFSQELVALLDSGLSLIESIEMLARKARHTESRHTLDSLLRLLQEGQSFSKALESMPDAFPVLYVATMRTSERTGDLAAALRRFLAYHRQLNLIREKVVAASVYPALLLGVGMIVVLFLLGYVVPRFSLVYEDLGRNLPWMSRMLMQWGQFIARYGWQMGLATVGVIGGCVYLVTRSAVRARVLKGFWALPVLGEKIQLYQLARFTRTLAMLVNGGIPFVAALEMVRGLLHQPALQVGLSKAINLVREGRSVSDAFAANELATEVGVRLLTVGERSGELGQSLERIATLYDDEIARWVDWFTKLFEPVLMIGIGLVIGVIVVLMYLPIFELANSLQ
ncbi:MAG TPA: type II secretion system F family protein [Duganella sp.]|nr:type II secretion system F family protein [Duganella sp.]